MTFPLILDEEKTTLPLLSESLVLDNLWETLSACLLELEYTPDHHAVLVLQVKDSHLKVSYHPIVFTIDRFTIIITHALQPAVEAFFLVHSSSSTSRDRDSRLNTNSENREVPDLAPVSPIYPDNDGQSEVAVGSWEPQKTLPPDQLKFLKFAGACITISQIDVRQTIIMQCRVSVLLIQCNVYIHFQKRTGLYSIRYYGKRQRT